VQALRDVHDTALRFPPVEDLGVGIDWSRHLLPFQASARFTLRCVPLWIVLPTAVQAVADAQDTPLKAVLLAPVGMAVGRIRQRVPFHLSASVNDEPDKLAACEPTAVQARAEVHETAESSLMPALTLF